MAIRYQVRDADWLRAHLDHPARVERYSARELARIVGVSPTIVAGLTSGSKTSCDADVAEGISNELGCHVMILFSPVSSTSRDGDH